jgi:hypothetical protein
VKYAPVDQWSWMAQAVAEAEGQNGVSCRELSCWFIATNGTGGVRIEKVGQEVKPGTNGKVEGVQAEQKRE